MFWIINQNGALLKEQLSTLNEQNKQEASLLRLQRLAEDTREEREKLGSHFLLRESDSIIFLSEIESLAPNIGLSLETKELKQVVEKDKTTWIEVTFGATGARTDVENFIQILEIIPYVSRVMTVKMEARSTEYWQAIVTVQVQLLQHD